MEFKHRALDKDVNKKLIYIAMSKNLSYFKEHISKFVLEEGFVPLNPFMSFNYFLLDALPRDIVREANNNLVKNSDEIWVFGPVSDGVLAEIKLAKELNKPIRYFKILKDKKIEEIDKEEVKFEEDTEQFKTEI